MKRLLGVVIGLILGRLHGVGRGTPQKIQISPAAAMTAGARRKGDPLISRRRRQLQALQRSEALIDLREGDLDGTHAGIEAADVGLEAVEAAVQPSANSITVTDNWTVTTATPVPTIHFASLLIGGKRTHPLARIIQEGSGFGREARASVC